MKCVHFQTPVTSTHHLNTIRYFNTISSFQQKTVTSTQIRQFTSREFHTWRIFVEVKCWIDGFVLKWRVEVTNFGELKSSGSCVEVTCWSSGCVEVRGTYANLPKKEQISRVSIKLRIFLFQLISKTCFLGEPAVANQKPDHAGVSAHLRHHYCW